MILILGSRLSHFQGENETIFRMRGPADGK